MSSERELDEGIKSIKSAWRREHNARLNLEKMLENVEAESAKLRELAKAAWVLFLKHGAVSQHELPEVDRVRESLNELGIKASLEELGIEVADA